MDLHTSSNNLSCFGSEISKYLALSLCTNAICKASTFPWSMCPFALCLDMSRTLAELYFQFGSIHALLGSHQLSLCFLPYICLWIQNISSFEGLSKTIVYKFPLFSCKLPSPGYRVTYKFGCSKSHRALDTDVHHIAKFSKKPYTRWAKKNCLWTNNWWIYVIMQF